MENLALLFLICNSSRHISKTKWVNRNSWNYNDRKQFAIVFVSSGNFSLVQKFQSAGSLPFFLGRGRKQLGDPHKFARNWLYRYLKWNGKSVRNDTSKIQILVLAHCEKALNKGCDKNFDSCPMMGREEGKWRAVEHFHAFFCVSTMGDTE